MPNADECDLASVYVRYSDTAKYGDIAEQSIKDNASFDLVLELEAGQTIFNLNPKYDLFVVLNDLSNNSQTVLRGTQAGFQSDGNWPTTNYKYFWTIAAGTVITAVQDDHVFQAIGVMSVGGADPQVDIQQSELFIVTQP